MPHRVGPVKKRQFLIVENSAEVAAIFRKLFELLGHELHIVLSPEEALDVVQQICPEVVYTAIVFNEMHGFELCTRIKRMSQLSETRVVALVAAPYVEVNDVCRATGFDAVLFKPCTFESLADTIRPAEGHLVNAMLGILKKA